MRKILILGLLGYALCASGQLTVLEDGRTVLGTPCGTASTLSPATLSIFDVPPSDSAVPAVSASGYLSFGSGMGSMIYGSGENGYVRVKANSIFSVLLGANTTPAMLMSTLTGRCQFSCNVAAPAFLTSSDARLKKNIEALSGSYKSLLDVTPVSYTLALPGKTQATLGDSKDSAAANSTTPDERTHFGFIAQEIKELYPNLVVEDEEGMMSLDYTGFIPLLVDAYKDLVEKVKVQEEVIAALCGGQSPSMMPSGVATISEGGAVLKQNRPNPFNTQSVIECTVPASAASAFICVYDLQGKQVKRIDIREKGDVSCLIDASELAPGMYIYALIVDGAEADSKRMIITD